MSEQKEKWEEEFDENFKYVFPEKDPIYGGENAQNKNAIKIFISHVISEAVEKEREKYVVYEDELGEMTDEEYSNWFDNSWIEDGVRIGYRNLIVKNS